MLQVFQKRWVRGLLHTVSAVVGLACGVTGAVAALGGREDERFRAPRPPIVEVTRAPHESGEWVELKAADGFVTRLGVVRDASHDAPRPVVVVLGGHRTGRTATRLVGDPGQIAVIAVDYPFDGPQRIRGAGQIARHVPGMRRAILDTPRALSQALDWALTQPWVDPARAELLGVSLGAPFAAAAGAHDTRFSRVWIIQGGADNRQWLESNLERRISQPALRSFTAFVLHRLAHGASFDTREWVGRIAPRPVIVIGAREDQRLPHAQVEGLYDAAGEPRELHWVAGKHVNPRRPETVQPLLALVRSRLER